MSVTGRHLPWGWSLTYSRCTKKLGDGQLLQHPASRKLRPKVAQIKYRAFIVRVQLANVHVEVYTARPNDTRCTTERHPASDYRPERPGGPNDLSVLSVAGNNTL